MCIQQPYEIVSSHVLPYTVHPDQDSRIRSRIPVEVCCETRWNLSLPSVSSPNYSVPLFDSSRKSEIQSLKFDSPPLNLFGRGNLLSAKISIFTTRDYTPPHCSPELALPCGQIPSYIWKISYAHLAEFHTSRTPNIPIILDVHPLHLLANFSSARLSKSRNCGRKRIHHVQSATTYPIMSLPAVLCGRVARTCSSVDHPSTLTSALPFTRG